MTEEYKKSTRHGIFITPIQQMISSCSGAFLTSLFVTPFDVVRIRLQAQKKPLSKGMCFMYCNGLMDHVCACVNGQVAEAQWYRKGGHFTGVQDAFVKIVKTEGIGSLWSGLPPTLVMAIPATVIYFSCYEQLKVVLKYQDGQRSDWWKPMVAGASARVWAVSLISPMEMIRTKMQSEQLTYKQIREAVRRTINNRGVLSLWRGLAPTLMKDVPFSAFYWFSYENMKTYVLLTRGNADMTFLDSFSAGAFSGTMTAILTQPFDVIKTHRQIELGEIMTHARNKEITSTWVLMKNLYEVHGVKALYTGLLPRIAKVAPACAIMISSYEYFKKFFRNLNESKQAQSEPKRLDS
ncbi:solute carrier family 25 member 40-like [Gigantopelta aegis]|uniref:solute carrier family 25 member 40-like n=1 Tax=Gigantopelta aegis TaxID=1735272 RepID=UPI001B8896DD|nr:solute carrier family 25 member 40-like [Gigantopelta aegis]XP_041372403.1 solute carrier family 25 member 40-like [Gigantopelta aegis]